MQTLSAQSIINWLESPAGRLRKFAGAPWSRLAPVSRLHLGDMRIPIVGIGGSTLGGSGRTPLVIACAEALSPKRKIAVVCHGYASSIGAARRVGANDSASLVGDEARLIAARVPKALVFVGASRTKTLRLASEQAELVLVDGLLQTWPRRVSLSVLAVDCERPWGSEACLPGGDLRASIQRLAQRADMTVTQAQAQAAADPFTAKAVLSISPWSSSLFAQESERASLASLAAMRIGLFTAIARPQRFERALEGLGIGIHTKIRARDHHPLEAVHFARTVDKSVDAWILTEKCLFGLGGIERAENLLGSPVCVIRQTLTLPSALASALSTLLRPL
jgi:tetraacyldisaccharide 4'-kinase